jgi:hypothetical protein
MKKILIVVLAAYVFSPAVFLADTQPAYATPKTKAGKKSAGTKKADGCANDMIVCVDVCGTTTASGTKTRDDCVTRCGNEHTACGK